MTKKGFTFAEMLITIAVLSIFLAVILPLITIQKNFTGMDKDAADCVVKEGAADLNSVACSAALSKCQRDKGNTCNTLLNLVSAYSDSALTVLGEACTNGGKQACDILINRCIDNSANCEVADETYDIQNYLALAATDTSTGKETMYNLLKSKMELGISNIGDRVVTACSADSTSMACKLLGHKIYHFTHDDQFDFTEMESEYGTVFKNSNAQLVNDYWMKHYGGASIDYVHSIAVSGNYAYITGYKTNIGGDVDILVMKLNATDGTSVWTKHYGGVYMDYGRSIAISGDYIYITGYEASNIGGNIDAFAMKLNTSDGVAIWKKHYGGASFDYGHSISISGDYIYITGYEQSDTLGNNDVLVMKLNATDGTSVWTKHYGGASLDVANSIIVSGDYIYITGYENSDTAGTSDAFIMKLNAADGTSVWKKNYGGASSDSVNTIAISGDYVYVSGHENSDTAGSYDAFVMRFNKNQTSHNMGVGWTADGVDMGASWTADGAAIKTSTTAADSPWTTAAAQTTGGTGIDMGALWTADGLLIRKTTDGSNYWTSGLQKDGVPIP